MPAAAVVGAAVVGGAMSSRAAKSAAQTQADAAQRATDAQERMFERQVELQQPFRDTGLQANNRLSELMGLGGNTSADGYGSLMRDFSMADFQADPGYEFRRTEGMRGVENSAAARGGLLSGAALKAIQRYGQDLASQEYGNAYQRYNANQTNRYNRLAGVVNTSQGATNQVSNAASQFGQQQGANIIGAGNAQAAGTVGSANAWNNAISQGTNIYQQNQLMDLIRRPGVSAYGADSAFTPSGSTSRSFVNY
jgi:hypothetical protein